MKHKTKKHPMMFYILVQEDSSYNNLLTIWESESGFEYITNWKKYNVCNTRDLFEFISEYEHVCFIKCAKYLRTIISVGWIG